MHRVSVQTPQPAMVTTTVAPPKVPSLRPWPTAFDLAGAVTYVVDLVASFVDAFLHPFAAGPYSPSVDPAEWALLAWVRREFFNETPSAVAGPAAVPRRASTTTATSW